MEGSEVYKSGQKKKSLEQMVVISHRKHKQMEETGNKKDVCTEYKYNPTEEEL